MNVDRPYIADVCYAHMGKPYHHGNLRAELIRLALDAAEREDLKNLSLRELARAAGVSPNAPYRHFRTKQALLEAVAVEGYAQLRATLDAVAAGPESLPGAVEAYVNFLRARPGLASIFLSRDLPDPESSPLQQAKSDVFGAWLRHLRAHTEGLSAGETITRVAAAWAMADGAYRLSACRVLSFLPETLRPSSRHLAAYANGSLSASAAPR